MVWNEKRLLIVSKEEESILDSQSKMCNWLYNQLFTMVEDDYKTGNSKRLLTGRNLRDQVPLIKEKYPWLKKVHSSPLKNAAFRLKDAYKRWFDKTLENEKPHYRSWKAKWFSLFYDEPKKGFHLQDNRLTLKLGKRSDEEHKELKKTNKQAKKQIELPLLLHEPFQLKEGQVLKTLRITKEVGRFYAIFTVEQTEEPPKVPITSWIALDPNHKNLSVGIDHEGNSFEFKSLKRIITYWDKRIDEIKSKRDKCEKHHTLVVTPTGSYYKPSRRFQRLDGALEHAYHKRREQIKSLLYSYAHMLSKEYDEILIGDYTPTIDTAQYDNMHRAMLNQTPIGQWRHILNWVQARQALS